jgi:hypothetical protein
MEDGYLNLVDNVLMCLEEKYAGKKRCYIPAIL